MITLRKSEERGHIKHGWLDTFHTFSFGDYHDPDHENFRSLRVINEDTIAGGQGFGMHPHRNMEIITYIVSGELAHKDSLGSNGVIKSGEIQHMSAGSGVMHSEFNSSKTEPVHLLQIWITPDRPNVKPSYDQQPIPDLSNGELELIADRAGTNGAMKIEQDVKLYAAKFPDKKSVSYDVAEGRHAWLQLIKGSIELNGQRLEPGDGAAVSDERRLQLSSESGAEFLLFDLA